MAGGSVVPRGRTMLTSRRTMSGRSWLSSNSMLTLTTPPDPSSSGQQLMVMGAASSAEYDHLRTPTGRPTGKALPPLSDTFPVFSYARLSTLGCVAKDQSVVHLAAISGRLTATMAAAPTSVLAVRVRLPLTSALPMAPSRFIVTVSFSSRARVRGVVGAAAGEAVAVPSPKRSEAPPFAPPPRREPRLSSAAMAAIMLSFFLPMPPRVIPFAITLGPSSTGSGSAGLL
mmetsp:Transcript_44661/g.82838  ORF Transcript_44661/g.82838 Transcript_44661/m.82838 type:complete len:229 (+) Transcript_44661:621-1307(+)